jgi:hypothetical protein
MNKPNGKLNQMITIKLWKGFILNVLELWLLNVNYKFVW